MTTYHLALGPPAPATAPELDRFQRAVVDHPGGPLLVLAGPGTGKTTTLVEAIVDRVERRGVAPDSVLALTFSRKAAEQLRDRVTARLGRTTATTLSCTFHSFAYGLVRRYSPTDLYAAPLRLLSAPEQDVVLQGLLTDSPESVAWPASLRRALGTRGFAREVQAVIARAREKGLGPEELERLGAEHGVDAYVAAGRFLGQYLDVLDSTSAIDYPDLVARAVVEAQSHRDELRARLRHVFVDEYQDTDPSQVALLQALAGDGRDLTVVGDPHQSIYAFRGADVRGILDFPASFPRADGRPADVSVLRTTRRFGAHLLLASQRVAARLPLAGSIGAEAAQAFVSPRSALDLPPGRVEVTTYDTERAEAEHLADLLRRAHLEDGRDWSDMAVLVRSGRASIPPLQRSLAAAGVPVEVASDDTPLVREPAVAPLLAALRAVVLLGAGEQLPTDAVEGLLVSPLAGLDATELRGLARELRAVELAHAERPRPSIELLRDALGGAGAVDPGDGGLSPGYGGLADLRSPAARKAGVLARLLAGGSERLRAGATAEEVLWELWAGTDWPRRLRASVDAGGQRARLAHRDLDAVVALFDAAARAEEKRGHTAVADFLATLVAQEIPGDTLADRGVRGAAVRLLTAHRSKGLEWPLVVVAHAQEDGWPDLRRRSTLLQADRIGPGELLPPVTTRDLLAEERRLFYVAATRARERLLVTAVRSPEDEGEQPSRFLVELGVEVRHVQGRPRRPLSTAGLVAELRRTVADDSRSDALRAVAADRLARLAATEVAGRPVAPQADPRSWWGTRALTAADRPVRPVDEPVRLTASALTSLEQCPARWFLEREAGGASEATQAQGFGNVLHELADRISRGDLPADAAAVDDLMAEVDAVWGQVPFRTPWSAAREREEVRHALTRFIAWHNRPGGREVLATEQPFEAEVALPGGEVVRVHGYADRLELDADGRVVVVDLKTGKYPASDLARHPQLGLYQLAVDHGAVADLAGDAASGGAELWQLRQDSRTGLKVQVQAPQQPGPDGRTPVQEQLSAAVSAIRAERFEARPGGHCDRCAFRALCPTQVSGTVLH
ncbi:MAG TPA: ATP-dependent DNA helicase [Nocardioidaceae bacterium]|nr:ATP-dependent DNA helicase [Nocardioidaceae bacterium]